MSAPAIAVPSAKRVSARSPRRRAQTAIPAPSTTNISASSSLIARPIATKSAASGQRRASIAHASHAIVAGAKPFS